MAPQVGPALLGGHFARHLPPDAAGHEAPGNRQTGRTTSPVVPPLEFLTLSTSLESESSRGLEGGAEPTPMWLFAARAAQSLAVPRPGEALRCLNYGRLLCLRKADFLRDSLAFLKLKTSPSVQTLVSSGTSKIAGTMWSSAPGGPGIRPGFAPSSTCTKNQPCKPILRPFRGNEVPSYCLWERPETDPALTLSLTLDQL